ncbi:uncharacterized protein LY89DRAFT_1956 [Mollisia scopiformis]|uniref:Uncharacterized protein n=1 Tax=Mollisia scopiformis TaxID=149040 RepID=A0A194XTV7_MOLSC|nr:uncharacterized protein LY89DRAFT_1956 [Mollisia scopiformis]KUJ23755.1 hypothetical protein LY89DRAFT_1956 [Mollisia scopiformis]
MELQSSLQACPNTSAGTLSTLPIELRERIYGLVVDLNEPIPVDSDLANPSDPYAHHPNCTCSRSVTKKKSPPKLGLLLVSKAIHNETRIVLFRVNDWNIEVEDDNDGSFIKSEPNVSIMGRSGWMMQFSHGSMRSKSEFTPLQTAALDRDNMWAELRSVHVSVGAPRAYGGGGIREYDILPWKRQTRPGPERPSFVPLLKVIDNICDLLGNCRQLHMLRISIRSIEKIPGSIELVLHPFRQLRRVKKTSVVCMGIQDDMWVDWNLKGSYGRYLDKILGMPDGAKAPKYVGDKKEPKQNDKEIFDMIGARWCGGDIVAYPTRDDGDEDEPDDDDDEQGSMNDDEMAEFEAFLDHMGMPGPMMGALGIGWGTDSEEEDDEDDSEEDFSDEDGSEEDEEDEDDSDDEIPAFVYAALAGLGPLPGFVGDSEQEDTDDEMPELVLFSPQSTDPASHRADGGGEWEDTDDTDDDMPELLPSSIEKPAEPEGFHEMVSEDVD